MSEIVYLSSNSGIHNSNIDWRAKKPFFDKQMAHFCMTEEMADVEFVFCRENKITKIPAHKFALSVSSEVFQKEFAYNSAENESEKRSKVVQVVEVKDERVEIDAFRIVLLFIYNAYKNVELTGDSALAVLYIAMKYLIYPLESLCIDYLVENMCAENVLTISQFCIDCQTGSRLIYECREFVRHKTESVLKSESFAKISHKFLILLLKQKFLNATEVRLFEAALRWAKSACEDSGEDANDGKNIRSKLGTALNLIRFPAMSTKEFAEIVGPTGILSLEEQRDVLYMIGGAKPIGQPISTIAKPRRRNEFLGSLDILKHSSFTRNELSLLVRIDNFPEFVASKGEYSTRAIKVSNTFWKVYIASMKRHQTTGEYIPLNSASADQPETLAAYLYGSGKIPLSNDCSFDVNAKFKFKQPQVSEVDEFTHKYFFNTSDRHMSGFGFPTLRKIDELLNAQNGYLVEHALELVVDVTITEDKSE